MKRQRVSVLRWMGWASALLIVAACGTAPTMPTQAVAPSDTPEPTDTPVPPPTIIPTATLKPGQVRGEVVRILDEGTIEVNVDGEILKVCYFEIWTPKSDDSLMEQALEANRELVEGKTVILEASPRYPDERACYRRNVFLEDGTLVNAELVRLGLAEYIAFHKPWGEYKEELDSAQEEAIALGIGIWREELKPTPKPTITTVTRSVESKVGMEFRIADLSPMSTADEYIQINCDPVFPKLAGRYDLSGWRIVAEGTGKVFVFPEGVELFGGNTCRVYTGESASTCDGRKLSFKSSTEVWQNEGDCAYLYNADGVLEAKYCY